MRSNPTMAKQLARQVASLGRPLWRQVVAARSSLLLLSSSSADGRLSLTPGQIQGQLAVHAAQSDTNKQFVEQRDNMKLAQHLMVLTQLPTCHNGPLTTCNTPVTGPVTSLPQRWMAWLQLQVQPLQLPAVQASELAVGGKLLEVPNSGTVLVVWPLR